MVKALFPVLLIATSISIFPKEEQAFAGLKS